MDSKLVAAWVGISTGIVAIVTFFLSILQRKKELRWKQADLARKLVDDMFADSDSAEGFYMLDGVNRPYKGFADQSFTVRTEEVVATVDKALAKEALDDKQARILFCIDSLFYFVNRIENSLKSKLILFDDISTPCEYYVGLIARHKTIFSKYMRSVGYLSLLQFCERFSVWND